MNIWSHHKFFWLIWSQRSFKININNRGWCRGLKEKNFWKVASQLKRDIFEFFIYYWLPSRSLRIINIYYEQNHCEELTFYVQNGNQFIKFYGKLKLFKEFSDYFGLNDLVFIRTSCLAWATRALAKRPIISIKLRRRSRKTFIMN